MFAKHQIQIQALDEACTKQKPYRAIDLSGLVARFTYA